MKLYAVVFEDDEYGDRIEAVYIDKEKADLVVERMESAFHTVKEIETQENGQPLLEYIVDIDRRGTEVHMYTSKRWPWEEPVKETSFCRDWVRHMPYTFVGKSGVSFDEALRLAEEARVADVKRPKPRKWA